WNDRYLGGDAFARFVQAEEARVREILRKLGTGGSESSALIAAGPYPALVLSGLTVCLAAAALEIFRRRQSSQQQGAGPGGRVIALLFAGIAIDLALMERAGFVPASAALFWCTARAFDPGHPKRDVAFALGISTGAYLLFAHLLELPLPAGPLLDW